MAPDRRNRHTSRDPSYSPQARSATLRPRTGKKLGYSPQAVPRKRTGCLSCRIRRKPCLDLWVGGEAPKPKEACRTCKRLKIECLGYDDRRPGWMQEPGVTIAIRDAIKGFLKPFAQPSTPGTLSLAKFYQHVPETIYKPQFPIDIPLPIDTLSSFSDSPESNFDSGYESSAAISPSASHSSIEYSTGSEQPTNESTSNSEFSNSLDLSFHHEIPNSPSPSSPSENVTWPPTQQVYPHVQYNGGASYDGGISYLSPNAVHWMEPPTPALHYEQPSGPYHTAPIMPPPFVPQAQVMPAPVDQSTQPFSAGMGHYHVDPIRVLMAAFGLPNTPTQYP